MLQFIHTSMLLGAVGATIPIIIHFLAKRKRHVIHVSTLQFLEAMVPRTLRWLQLRQRLLLIIRTLLLLVLVLALMQPFWQPGRQQATGGKPGPRRVALLIDHSASMQVHQRLEQARMMAHAYLAALDPQDQVFLAWLGDEIGPVEVRSPAEWQSDIDQKITGWQDGHPEACLLQAKNWLRIPSAMEPELAIISDFQASTWNQDRMTAVDFSGQVFLMPVGEAVENWSVNDFHLTSRVFEPGRPLSFTSEVENNTSRPVSDLLIRLFINDAAKAQKLVTLAAGEKKIVVFNTDWNSPGLFTAKVQLEADDFAVDNQRLLAAHLPSPLRVLIVGGEHAEFNALSHAVSAAGFGEHAGSADMQPYESGWLTRLSREDVLILHNIVALNDIELEALKRFLASGGGVLVIPGDRTDLSRWDRDLIRPLMHCNIAGLMDGANTGSLRLARPGPDAPFFQGLFDRETENFEMPALYKFLVMQLRDSAEVLLTTEDRRPWLIASAYDHGRLILMGSGIEHSWSGLTQSSFFAALLHRVISALGAGELMEEKSYEPGEMLRFSVNKRLPTEQISVQSPDGRSVKPVFFEDESGLSVEYGEITEAGFYQFMVLDSLCQAAVSNINPMESNLYPASSQVLDALFPDAVLSIVEKPDQAALQVGHARRGISLIPLLWFLAGMLTTAEMLVARHSNPAASAG